MLIIAQLSSSAAVAIGEFVLFCFVFLVFWLFIVENLFGSSVFLFDDVILSLTETQIYKFTVYEMLNERNVWFFVLNCYIVQIDDV